MTNESKRAVTRNQKQRNLLLRKYCCVWPQQAAAVFRKHTHTHAVHYLLRTIQPTDTASDELEDKVWHLADEEPDISLRSRKRPKRCL